MNTNTQFSLASITKLFTGTVIFKLREKNLINLDDKICKYLGREILDSIDIIDNVDYSKEITIRQLLSHTSGLPDYFTEGAGGEKSKENIRKERDMSYTIKDILTDLKHLKPHFKPGEPGKAFYSDDNYQLLGLIIQKVTGKTLPESYREYIFQPLNLKNTYLLEPNMKADFAPFYYQHKSLLRPQFIVSEGPTGGMISNCNDMMIFLKAYFTGKLFPKSYLDENKKWNPIQFVPLQYGTNLMKMGNMIGHSGSTGTVAFYIPENDIFIVGATGQLDSRKTLVLTIKILQMLNYTFRM
jgi:CubicO group peptidase (beta-lactamase class C family)